MRLGTHVPGGRYVTRILEVDGELFVILSRGPWGLHARRLNEGECERAMRQLDDVHVELEATFRGPGG